MTSIRYQPEEDLLTQEHLLTRCWTCGSDMDQSDDLETWVCGSCGFRAADIMIWMFGTFGDSLCMLGETGLARFREPDGSEKWVKIVSQTLEES